MLAFLAPLPIIHAKEMLNMLEAGERRFAFGSGALAFFNQNISELAKNESLDAFIYITKTGASSEKEYDINLGIFIRCKLYGWVFADSRGHYPKGGTASRPNTTKNDEPMALFWEIGEIQKLEARIPLSDFRSPISRKPYDVNFVPQGPLMVEINL